MPLESQLTSMEQEVNIQNMNVELVAQMFKNYQSNVLFHLEGELQKVGVMIETDMCSNGDIEGSNMNVGRGEDVVSGGYCMLLF